MQNQRTKKYTNKMTDVHLRHLRERQSFCVCTSLPFGLESRMLDLIVLVPDYCLVLPCYRPYKRVSLLVIPLFLNKFLLFAFYHVLVYERSMLEI